MPYLQISRIYHEKLIILPKRIYKLNAILIRMPLKIHKELEKKILKCMRNPKRPEVVNIILSRKSNAGGSIAMPGSQITFQSHSVKWYRHKDSHSYMPTQPTNGNQ